MSSTHKSPIRTFQKNLPVALTHDELRIMGQEMARGLQETAQEEAKQADIKASMKARLLEFQCRTMRLAATINSRTEYRDITVEVWPVGGNGYFVQEVRTDTGEIIAERQSTDEERQPALALPADEGT